MAWSDALVSGSPVALGAVIAAGVGALTESLLERRRRREARRSERLAACSDALASIWELGHRYEGYQAHVKVRAWGRRTNDAAYGLMGAHERVTTAFARASLVCSEATRTTLDRLLMAATELLQSVGDKSFSESNTAALGHIMGETREALLLELRV